MTWPTVQLSDVADVIRGVTYKKEQASGSPSPGMVPLLRATNIGGSLDLKSGLVFVPECVVSRTQLLRKHDIVLASSSGSLSVVGKSARLLDSWHGTFGAFCAVIRVRDSIDPRYLSLYLMSHAVRTRWSEAARGTNINNLKKGDLTGTPVPLPPLGEQRRIVDLLEDHLSRLDAANHAIERARSSAAAMVRASLQAGLRGELIEDELSEGTAADIVGETIAFAASSDDRLWPIPESWAWVRLGEVFQINVGSTPSRAKKELWSGELAWVSSGEVSFGRITATKEHITREAAGNPLTRIQHPGTVMLAMIGEGKTRGQAAILDIEAAHNQNCASIRVGSTPVLPEYIFGYLQERYLETRRGGSGGQQQALNKSAIQQFPVPIAPLGTQRRLVEAWTETREAVHRLNHDLQAATQRNQRLRQSVLAAAFSGRLTGNDANLSLGEESGAMDPVGDA